MCPVRVKIAKIQRAESDPTKISVLGEGNRSPKPTPGGGEERVRSSQTRMRKLPSSSTGMRLLDPLQSCFVAGSGKRDRKSSFSVGAALAVLESVVERGEKLEPQLDSRIVVSYFADAFERLPSRKYAKLRAPEVTSKTFDDTMMPASKSSGVQCLSESRVARLM